VGALERGLVALVSCQALCTASPTLAITFLLAPASSALVVSSAISHDLAPRTRGVRHARLVVLGLSAVAVVVALVAPKEIYENVLSAWTAMGAAFGPLLLLTLARGPLSPRGAITTMIVGFTAAVVTHVGLDLPAEQKWISQVLPYALAFAPFTAGMR